MMAQSWPRRARARGNEPTTSAKPPVLAKTTTSEAASNTFIRAEPSAERRAAENHYGQGRAMASGSEARQGRISALRRHHQAAGDAFYLGAENGRFGRKQSRSDSDATVLLTNDDIVHQCFLTSSVYLQDETLELTVLCLERFDRLFAHHFGFLLDQPVARLLEILGRSRRVRSRVHREQQAIAVAGVECHLRTTFGRDVPAAWVEKTDTQFGIVIEQGRVLGVGLQEQVFERGIAQVLISLLNLSR